MTIRGLSTKGIKVEDFGTFSTNSVDYPEFVREAARAVAEGHHPLGIIVGGSGNEAIVANRFVGIRCAVVWNTRTACLAKEHGDCNMIAIGQRMMSKEEAVAIVKDTQIRELHQLMAMDQKERNRLAEQLERVQLPFNRRYPKPRQLRNILLRWFDAFPQSLIKCSKLRMIDVVNMAEYSFVQGFLILSVILQFRL